MSATYNQRIKIVILKDLLKSEIRSIQKNIWQGWI